MDKLKQFWQWLVGAAVVILGAIFLARRSGQGHTINAARSAGAAAEHTTLAASHAQAAQSEASKADQQHELAVEAAKIENRQEDITPVDIVKRAKRGRTV